MNLKDYFKKRLTDGSVCEKIVGEEGLGRSKELISQYQDLLSDIETGAFVGACESCKYSSEEIQIYKAGLMTIRLFLETAKEEFEMRQKLKTDQEETKKQTRRNPTY